MQTPVSILTPNPMPTPTQSQPRAAGQAAHTPNEHANIAAFIMRPAAKFPGCPWTAHIGFKNFEARLSVDGPATEQKANDHAAFIVRACNEYAGLLSAHETVARTLSVISTNITVLGGQLSERDDKEFGAWLLTLQAEVKHALAASRAALQLAKEGQP